MRLPDTARLTDPVDRLAVAAAASRHFDHNTPMYWLLIWETTSCFSEHPESQQVLVSLEKFFDTFAYRQRGTFMFNAIHTATDLAKTQLASKDGAETYILTRGRCKTYATSANMVWYTGTSDKLQKIVIPLATSSPKAAAEPVAQIQSGLQQAPIEEKQTVWAHQYKLKAADVMQRLAELITIKPH